MTDYNHQAERWVRDSPQSLSDLIVRTRVLEILDRYPYSGLGLVDAGCGEGYMARKLSQRRFVY